MATGCSSSGTTGFDYTTMTIADDVVAQCEQCLKNIGAALAEAGSGFSDVVRVHYILPDPDDFEPCWPALRRVFRRRAAGGDDDRRGAARPAHAHRDRSDRAQARALNRAFTGDAHEAAALRADRRREPGILDDENQIRDLSLELKDFDAVALSPEGLADLAAIDVQGFRWSRQPAHRAAGAAADQSGVHRPELRRSRGRKRRQGAERADHLHEVGSAPISARTTTCTSRAAR